MSLSGWMLQKVCHRVQDFARKVFIRYRAGQRHRSDERAESQDRSRSCLALTVLVDERSDGVHISYDRMASLLASYGSADALAVARDLDKKVETLLSEAAG